MRDPMDSRHNKMNVEVWDGVHRHVVCCRDRGRPAKKRSGFEGTVRGARPPSITPSIRRHVQETFGGIQDIRYDTKPLLLALVSDTILAPLRTSDRKKLKQRLIHEFSLSPEIGELLVPEGLLSVKYTSHSRVPGVCDFPAISFDLFYSTHLGGLPLIGWRSAVVHDGERV